MVQKAKEVKIISNCILFHSKQLLFLVYWWNNYANGLFFSCTKGIFAGVYGNCRWVKLEQIFVQQVIFFGLQKYSKKVGIMFWLFSFDRKLWNRLGKFVEPQQTQKRLASCDVIFYKTKMFFKFWVYLKKTFMDQIVLACVKLVHY